MFDLNGHHRGVGSFYFRFTNCDLRRRASNRVNRSSSVANLRAALRLRVENPAFKMKTPSQNAGKIGKPMQGNASVLTPPPGGPPSYPPYTPPYERKNLYFHAFHQLFRCPILCRFCP
jgi:hypothetical protein